LLVSAAIVAAFGPLAAVHAQTATLDTATANAITAWHVAALNRVDPSLRDALAAMYADQALDPSVAASTATAKSTAEQDAVADIDRSSQALIENYYAQVAAATYASVPVFSEANDN
jgi:hypothetical protein